MSTSTDREYTLRVLADTHDVSEVDALELEGFEGVGERVLDGGLDARLQQVLGVLPDVRPHLLDHLKRNGNQSLPDIKTSGL